MSKGKKKKRKFSFGDGGVKGFFVRNVEKMVFGGVLLLVVFFIYAGYSIEPIKENPDRLKEVVNKASLHIEVDSSDVILQDRGAKTDHMARVKNIGELDDNPYSVNTPWSPLAFSGQNKRTDPEIFPPIAPEVSVFTGPVAYRRQDGDLDPLAEEANATAKAPRKKKKKKKRRRSAGSAGEGSAGMENMMDLEGGGGLDIGSMGMAGMSSGGRASNKTPQTDRVEWHAPQNSIHKMEHIVAVKMLVPYEKQFNAFQDIFLDSLSYDPTRDRPKYLYFFAERLEVSGDSDEKLDWSKAIKISSTGKGFGLSREWANTPNNISDLAYVDMNLTMPAPPLLMRPLDQLLPHSKIPLRASARQQAILPKKDAKEEGSETPDDLPGAINRPRGFNPSGGYPGGLGGSGAAGAMGLGGGEGAMGMGSGGLGMEGMGAMGMGSGGMGMGGMGMGTGYTGQAQEVVENKLLRFFDMAVEPGKKYRYRVKVLIEDPNNPNTDPNKGSASLTPSIASLDPEVLVRVRELKADDAKKEYYWRETEWSEPTDIVSIPVPQMFFAGPVVPGRKAATDRNSGVFIHTSEPTAKMVTVVFDRTRAVDVPSETVVYRGSVLNFTKDAEVLHPVLLLLKSLKEYAFKTDMLVADLDGGDVLPGGDKDNVLTAPGEMVLIDSLGNLVVQNELDDTDDYRTFVVAEEKTDKRAKRDEREGGFEGMMESMGRP